MITRHGTYILPIETCTMDVHFGPCHQVTIESISMLFRCIPYILRHCFGSLGSFGKWVFFSNLLEMRKL